MARVHQDTMILLYQITLCTTLAAITTIGQSAALMDLVLVGALTVLAENACFRKTSTAKASHTWRIFSTHTRTRGNSSL
jgi:hypothetical protein